MTGRTGGLFEKVLTPTQGEISVWVFFAKNLKKKIKNAVFSVFWAKIQGAGSGMH